MYQVYVVLPENTVLLIDGNKNGFRYRQSVLRKLLSKLQFFSSNPYVPSPCVSVVILVVTVLRTLPPDST